MMMTMMMGVQTQSAVTGTREQRQTDTHLSHLQRCSSSSVNGANQSELTGQGITHKAAGESKQHQVASGDVKQKVHEKEKLQEEVEGETSSRGSVGRRTETKLSVVIPSNQKSLVTPTIITNDAGAFGSPSHLFSSLVQLSGQEVGLFTGLPSCTPTSANKLAASGAISSSSINPFFMNVPSAAAAAAHYHHHHHHYHPAYTLNAGTTKESTPEIQASDSCQLNSKQTQQAAMMMSPLSFLLSPEHDAWLRLNLPPNQRSNLTKPPSHPLEACQAAHDLSNQVIAHQHQQQQQQLSPHPIHNNSSQRTLLSPNNAPILINAPDNYRAYQNTCSQLQAANHTVPVTSTTDNQAQVNNQSQPQTLHLPQVNHSSHTNAHHQQPTGSALVMNSNLESSRILAFEQHQQESGANLHDKQQNSTQIHYDSIYDPHLQQLYLNQQQQQQHQQLATQQQTVYQQSQVYQSYQQNRAYGSTNFCQAHQQPDISDAAVQVNRNQKTIIQCPTTQTSAPKTCTSTNQQPVIICNTEVSNSISDSLTCSHQTTTDPSAKSSRNQPISIPTTLNDHRLSVTAHNRTSPVETVTSKKEVKSKVISSKETSTHLGSECNIVIKKKSKGGRKKKQITHEELLARKNRSKERNRVAAKRCRQKRKQFLDELRARIDHLNDSNKKILKENITLKNELEFLKKHHKNCSL